MDYTLKKKLFAGLAITGISLSGTSSADINELSQVVFTGWGGDIETGANLSSGNTEKQTFHAAFSLNKEGEKKNWGHTIKGSADTSTENDIQSEEEYRVLGQSRYNLSETDYVFGELEYINDRFSGFQYRVSEGVGYGRKFYNTPILAISGEVSGGGRHTQNTQDVKTNSFLAKLSAKVKWAVTNTVELREELSISFADSTISLSETSLRNALSENLYLKVGLSIEHNSEVPVGTEKTDTLTSISIGYKF
ncbi:MAG: putative salt-induced outer membrane protein [bacterium]